MLVHHDRSDIDRRPDYFTIEPPPYNHFSVETPLCSPTYVSTTTTDEPSAYPENPLLAYRELQSLTDEPSSPRLVGSSNIMSMQTSAAHGATPVRPRPYPMQNVLHVTSGDDSTGSDSSISSMESANSCHELARCSRCQRTPSVDIKSGKSNMIQYGLNLWYCSRCASIVGLVKR